MLRTCFDGVVEFIVAVESELVREHLEKILRSAPFRATKRCQEFLRFVVTRSLDGQNEILKERIIGAEVFGRDAAYEPSEDAVVRVTVNEVRKRLAQYYIESGAQDPVRIELPFGSYIPEFKFVSAAPEVQTSKPSKVHWAVWGIIPLAIGLLTWAMKPRPTALDQFWEPITNNSSSTMVCTGSSLSYTLSNRVQLEYLRKHPDLVDAVTTPLQISPDLHVQGEDIIPVSGDQVSVGTFYSALDISSLLQKKGKQIQVRAGCELATDDLSEHSFILIGSFSNPWTMELSKDLRFTFKREMTPAGLISEVVDRESKEPSKWMLPNAFPYGATDHDFALITRVIHHESNQVMISAAGLMRFGTQIAAEFITNPVYWNDAMKSAPKGWEKKNMQVVLETDVVGKTPNTPRVLAMHFW